MSLRPATTYPYHSMVHPNVKFSLKIAQLLALIISLACAIAAQEKNAATPAPLNSAAFRAGERLTYNVNYSQFVSAAHVELLVAGRGNFFGHDGIQLKAHVETTGVVNVALLSINNDYTTFVYPETGLPYRAQQLVREAGRASEAAVDYNQPAGTEAIPSKLRLGEFPGTYDLLSALYRVRALPLTPGSTYFINARHAAEEYRAEIKVTGKQMIKTSVGSFDTIATRVNVKGAEYNIRVFFTDDEWHVPVLITARKDGADIQIELTGSAVTPPVATLPRTTVEPGNVRPVSTPTPASRGSSNPQNSPTPAAILDLPFKLGEQLNYQLYLGNSNQPVGSLDFALKSRGRYFNRDGLLFSANAQTSSGSIIAVRDQITSYVDPETLLPFRTEISFSEGKYRSNRSYNVDQDRGAVTSEGNRERIEIPVGTHDLVSALYAIRTFDLTIQKQNAISIMAVNRPRALLVRAQRRETIDLNGQKIPAIMLVLTTDDPQPDKMQVRIWVGDDARHLPLRLTAVTEVGAIRADLVIVPTNPR
jgi:hypothetical protein